MANVVEEETYEEDYQEYDEFDDDDDDRGLSGFAVLIMGIVMIGAFVSVVWIAYKQGMKVGRDGGAIETPYVAADPEPIKIETAEDGTTTVEDREVYDALDGTAAPVTTLAEGPEEPVDRSSDDTIGAIAAAADTAAAGMNDEVQDRLATLQAEDNAALDTSDDEVEVPAPATTSVTAASTTRPAPTTSAPAASGSAISGTHVVQVGAFRSNDEAMAQWSRMQTKLGDYLNGKAPDVEVADLGDRGTYYRLRVGPFSSSDGAKTYCAGLKERGQDCLIKGL